MNGLRFGTFAACEESMMMRLCGLKTLSTAWVIKMGLAKLLSKHFAEVVERRGGEGGQVVQDGVID
jgi:hypothetical protein